MDTIALETNPFITKEYESYDAYLEHQKSKYENGIKWLDGYDRHYEMFLNNLLGKVPVRNSSVLCLGARTGSEVRAFINHGAFAVGIDVNTGKDNKYVVYGDASELQYSDNSVDIVYTNCLDHFLKIDETLSEIKRVLKYYGKFIFLVPFEADTEKDRYGSTYWKDTEKVLNYLQDKYRFIISERRKLKGTAWFTDFVVMVNG